MVNSTCKCNFLFFEKDLLRRSIVQPLARAVVYERRRSIDVGLSDLTEVTPFREVLPDQPVGVLIQASLPTGKGMREIEVGLKFCGDCLVLCELSAVVPSKIRLSCPVLFGVR
jgi:hypothetical protein